MALSTQQILNLSIKEVEKMGEKELRSAVSTLRSTSRKRYERLEEKEQFSPAMKGISTKSTSTETVFPTIKGMDVKTLRNEFKRYRTFINAPTSTLTGAKKYEKQQKSTFTDFFGIDESELTDDEVETLWDVFDEMRNSGVGGVLNYRQVSDVVGEVYEERRSPHSRKKKTKRALKTEIKKRLEKIYESEQLPAKVYTSAHFENATD